ncbi:MAG: GAF domain-containing protein [Sandaracinaceae bacterium]|nr:GAF domain-containing protein [Sandaracinaceae bacterium]
MSSKEAEKELTVQASDWFDALRQAFQALGEAKKHGEALVCLVGASAEKVVFDGLGRKRYVLSPARPASIVPPPPTGASEPPPRTTLAYEDKAPKKGRPSSVPPPPKHLFSAVTASPKVQPIQLPPSKLSQPFPSSQGQLSPGDQRLALVTQAMEDLPFLRSPKEIANFVLQLLSELIPAQGMRFAFYDIAKDRLCVAAARGLEGKAQEMLFAGRGLVKEAIQHAPRPLIVDRPEEDPRFDAQTDGWPGLVMGSTILQAVSKDGHLFGLIQLVCPQGKAVFDEGDAQVLSRVAELLATFLSSSAMRFELCGKGSHE